MDMSDALSVGAVAHRIGMKSLSVGKNIKHQTTKSGGQEFESLRARHNLNVFHKILVIG
jgi:hypothetical protein